VLTGSISNGVTNDDLLIADRPWYFIDKAGNTVLTPSIRAQTKKREGKRNGQNSTNTVSVVPL
jgi:hypothetical protein